jgi:hypothetical protein
MTFNQLRIYLYSYLCIRVITFSECIREAGSEIFEVVIPGISRLILSTETKTVEIRTKRLTVI